MGGQEWDIRVRSRTQSILCEITDETRPETKIEKDQSYVKHAPLLVGTRGWA
jgi:hypothetical protein